MRLMKDYMLVNISCETVNEAVIAKGHGQSKGKARRVIQIKRAQ